jgi:hypothetical protein
VWQAIEFMQHKYAGMQEEGKLPVNYAGFLATTMHLQTQQISLLLQQVLHLL